MGVNVSEYFIFAFAFMFAILFHELGHLAAARLCRVQVLNICVGLGPEILGFTDRFGTRWKLGLWPIGGSCDLADQPRYAQHALTDKPMWQKATISFAGCLASFLLATAAFAVWLWYSQEMLIGSFIHVIWMIWLIGVFSAAIGVFNLFPIPPLDGGKLALLAFESWGRPLLKEVEKGFSRRTLIAIATILCFAIPCLIYTQI